MMFIRDDFRFVKSLQFVLIKLSVVAGNFLPLLLWFGPIEATIDRASMNPINNINSKWYTRYDSYPEYCSTPEQMLRRQIPSIRIEDMPPGTIGETRLEHVTALLRHGARTPYKDGMNCWDDSFYGPNDKRWDCSLTTIVSAPPPGRIHKEHIMKAYSNGAVKTQSSTSTYDDDDDLGMFLFEKKYDSLKAPLANALNGTCEQGQLISQGYEQEYTNGKILRDAYLSANDEKHTRLQLLDASRNGKDGKYLWDMIHYRSDDDQRTLMSGQIVLRGLLGPELRWYINHHDGEYPVIPLHTADMCADIIEPNTDLCPRMEEIQEDTFYYDKEYTKMFITSKEAHVLADFQRLVLKTPDLNEGINAVDCLMTTMCTDRTLPEAVNDYSNKNNYERYRDENRAGQRNGGSDVRNNALDEIYGPNRFQRLVDFQTSWYGYYITKNNGEYAKLATGPLWSEILDTVVPIVSGTHHDTQDFKQRLSIIAGHDTTIVPMLVSLGPNVWDSKSPPYASMMLLEIHSINVDGLSNRTVFQSNHAFRLLYNGEVLTHRIEGCLYELCDITVLLNIVQSVATLYNTNCTVESQATESFEKTFLQSQKWILLVSLCLVSALVGSMSTFVYLKYRLPRSTTCAYQQYHQAVVIVSSGYNTEDNQVQLHNDDSDGKCCL